MMHLARKLAARGVLITFVNTQFNHDRLAQSQAKTQMPADNQALEGLNNIRHVGIPDGLGHEAYNTTDVPMICAGLTKLEPVLANLAAKLVPAATCIIADVFVTSTAPVAKQFGIPHIGLWTMNAANYAAHYMFTRSRPPIAGNPGMTGDIKNLIINCIPGCPPLKFKELSNFLQPCDRSDFMYSYFVDCFQAVDDNELILMNTYDELEDDTLQHIFLKPKNMCTIGPVLPSDYLSCRDSYNDKAKKYTTSVWSEDGDCLQWLHKQKSASVLYVSFGSIAVLSAQQIEELASGLEASEQPFLMVVRPSLMYGNEAIFPEGFADRVRDRAMFVTWAPQLHVLSHPAIGGFLSHCGWNSTLESICKGHPMLCWPYFGDQMLDCRCIVDKWKIGLEFQVDEADGLVSRVEIEKKVRLLMKGDHSREMRERASKLRDAAEKAVMEGGSTHTNFESFLQRLLTLS